MSCRSPSLRELRANLPDNVVILPTAAPRQVEQRYSRAFRDAKQALREEQGVEFPFRFPGIRAQERRAQSLREMGRSAAAVLAHAILAEMDAENRLKVIGRLARSAHYKEGRQALDLAQTTMLTAGQQMDLMRALDSLEGADR